MFRCFGLHFFRSPAHFEEETRRRKKNSSFFTSDFDPRLAPSQSCTLRARLPGCAQRHLLLSLTISRPWYAASTLNPLTRARRCALTCGCGGVAVFAWSGKVHPLGRLPHVPAADPYDPIQEPDGWFRLLSAALDHVLRALEAQPLLGAPHTQPGHTATKPRSA